MKPNLLQRIRTHVLPEMSRGVGTLIDFECREDGLCLSCRRELLEIEDGCFLQVRYRFLDCASLADCADFRAARDVIVIFLD